MGEVVKGVNYLLFHIIVEIASAIVGISVFIVGWNARKFSSNSFYAILGIAYLFVGALDILHALAYQGMGIFPDGGNIAT